MTFLVLCPSRTIKSNVSVLVNMVNVVFHVMMYAGAVIKWVTIPERWAMLLLRSVLVMNFIRFILIVDTDIAALWQILLMSSAMEEMYV